MLEKIKQFIEDDRFFYCCLIVLLNLLAFYLGAYSVQSTSHEVTKSVSTPLLFEQSVPETAGTSNNPPAAMGGDYVASVNGTKYHFTWCSSAERINEENKIYFASVPEAEAAGYTPAATCPGLE